MAKAVAMLVAVALVVVAATSANGALAVQCDATKLAPCARAVIDGSAPTASCCSNLRAQESCLCEFARNPAYKKYVDSPNARHTLTSCSIAIPNC